jgi:hypothetical protein
MKIERQRLMMTRTAAAAVLTVAAFALGVVGPKWVTVLIEMLYPVAMMVLFDIRG